MLFLLFNALAAPRESPTAYFGAACYMQITLTQRHVRSNLFDTASKHTEEGIIRMSCGYVDMKVPV